MMTLRSTSFALAAAATVALGATAALAGPVTPAPAHAPTATAATTPSTPAVHQRGRHHGHMSRTAPAAAATTAKKN